MTSLHTYAGSSRSDAVFETARAQGIATARRQERERIRAILTAPEAAGREALAQHLALETDTPIAGAKAVLSKSSIAGPAPNRALAVGMRARFADVRPHGGPARTATPSRDAGNGLAAGMRSKFVKGGSDAA